MLLYEIEGALAQVLQGSVLTSPMRVCTQRVGRWESN